MANELSAEVVEADLEEDSGYFYQRLGELRFSPEEAPASEERQHGHYRRLAVASKHGVAAFADQKGFYIAHLRNLLSAATKGEEDQELTQVKAEEVCACTLPMSDASLALSSEEDLLAAWDTQTIKIWSLSALIQRRSSEPLTEWLVPSGTAVKQLAWRPCRAHGAVPEAAVLTVEGQLLRGSLGGQLQPLQDVTAGQVSCIAWSADGSLLALASASCVTVQHLESGRHFRTEFDSKEARDADGVVNVDTLAWLGSKSLLVSANLHPVEDLTTEMDIAPLAVMQWSTWDIEAGADPEELQLVEFIAPAVNADATAEISGPYSHVAHVPAWGAAVVAHRKASDDHIRLYEVGHRYVKAIDVTEDWSAIRIPSAMDYSDNYVTGLGMDFTSVDIEVMPPDPEASALPPSPVLLVATSDSALRFFTFAHMTKSTKGVVAPALPLSDTLPPMVAPEEQAEPPPPDVQEKAAGVPLPPADGEESEVEEESPAPAVPGPRPAAAPEERAAATALPASSEEEDSYDSSAERESETSSSAAAAARATHTALPPNDESDLADDADSGASRADSSTADQRPSISRLDISRQADGDDEADSAAPFGPLSGRKLDFGLAGTGLAEEAHKKPTSLPAPQMQEPAAAAPLPWTLPAPAPAIAALTPAAASTSSFSFGSMPAFGTGSTNTFKPASLAGSSAAASSGTVLGSVPSTAPPTKPGIFGSAPAFASGTAAPATSMFSKSQVPQALPSLPPQSTAQKLIAKAREAEATKAATAAASTPLQPLLSPTPQPSKPAATARSEAITAAPPANEPARLMAGTAAQKRNTAADEKAAIAQQQSKQQHAVRAAPQKPPPPEARLKGESRELAAMEEDFLKTLAETRGLEHAFSAAMAKTDGDADSGPSTRLGFQSLVSRTDALKSSVADILKSLATEKQRFSKLHNGWREDRARAEALLYFKGKHSNDASANGSVDDGGLLDPVLQELLASIDSQLEALQKQNSQLNDCLTALEERASMRLIGNPPRASTQQLYNAVNAQTSVAIAQLERLELLWTKLHDMGISRDEDDEDSSDLPPPFPYSGALSARKPSNSYADTPTNSSRHSTWRKWQQVRKSPLGRAKPRRPMALSPLISGATPNSSPWACDSASSLRRLLLEKVSMEGGVRLTRIDGVTTLPPSQPDVQEESEWMPSKKDVAAGTQPSALPPPVTAALPSPFGFGSSSSPFHDARATAKPPSLAPSFGQSAGLTRAGSSEIGVDRIQPQAAPFQREGIDNGLRKRQPSPFQATNILDSKEQLARRESTTSADSSGSTASAPLRPKHARASDTAEQPQVPPSNFRPFQRPATGFSFARAGSAALGHAEPADSSNSAAGSTNKGPDQGQAKPVPPVQSVAPKSVQANPSAAKMPPVPSRAAVAAAQAQAQAALQRTAPSSSAKMPPVPSRTAVAAAQAQGEAALRKSAGPLPAAKTPPIPSKSAVAAAQALGQAALQKTTAAPAAKVPPVPSKAALEAAQAQGEAALQKKPPAPAARMPPVPSKAALQSAQAQAQVALQKASPGSKRAAEATNLPASTPSPAAGSAQPAFNFADLSFGDAASPSASKVPIQPFGLNAQSSAAFSFASAMSMFPSAAAGTTASSSVASQAASPTASLAPSSSAAPASFQIANNLATSQPSLGLFGASASASALAAAPAVSTAGAPGISFGAPLSGGFGASASPGVASITRFGQQASAPSNPPIPTFGSQTPTSSTSAFGTLSFGASASQQAATPSSLTSGFGAFGGLGQSAPASAMAASLFGKGLSLGAPSTTSAPTPFTGGFGQPSNSSAAVAGFAGFGQSGPAFGQPQTPVSPAAPSSGAFSWGFGQSTGFSAQPSAVSSSFGQAPVMGSGFGQPASPGLGKPASLGFGTPVTPGFGAPATPGFGSPASPSAPFGGATSSNAFGAAAAQGSSGFGAFASMAGKPSPFGAVAQVGGGFAAAAQQGGGFGGFGGGSTFGAASTPAATTGNSDMWQMRK